MPTRTLLPQIGKIYRAAKREQNRKGEGPQYFEFLKYRLWCWRAHELQYLLWEIFARREYHFTCHRDRPQIVDCGANIGIATIFFKHMYPSASIVSFEADPASFQLLQRNVKENGLTDVVLEHAVVGGESGMREFFVDPTRRGSLRGSVHERRARNGIGMMLKAVRLSEYMMEHLGTVDLIKLDVEGAEVEVLDDLHTADRLDSVGQFTIEYHHNVGRADRSLSDFIALLENAGFALNLQAARRSERVQLTEQDILITAWRSLCRDSS